MFICILAEKDCPEQLRVDCFQKHSLVTTVRIRESMQSAGQRSNIKQIVLALLVIQNVTSILCMKHASRQKASDGHQALTTSIVVVSEVVKVTICLGEIFVRCCNRVTALLI